MRTWDLHQELSFIYQSIKDHLIFHDSCRTNSFTGHLEMRNWGENCYLGYVCGHRCTFEAQCLKSRHSSQSLQEAWTMEQPLYFYSTLFSQDRAIKEHSGCQLDEVVFPASLWQARICSLAERIGLGLVVLLSPRWQFS